MKHLFAWAAAGVGAALGFAANPASATVVTVTSGPNPGVVFDSGGYENVTAPASLSSPAPTGTYTSPSSTGVSASQIVTAGGTGGPTQAFSGQNMLAVPRTTTTYLLMNEFSRSINLATESFKLEYEFWSTASLATAFAIGDSSAMLSRSPRPWGSLLSPPRRCFVTGRS